MPAFVKDIVERDTYAFISTVISSLFASWLEVLAHTMVEKAIVTGIGAAAVTTLIAFSNKSKGQPGTASRLPEVFYYDGPR